MDLAYFLNALILVLTILIIARALISWIPNLDPRNPLVEMLDRVTDPILAPIRQFMPNMGIDLSPMIAILLLQFIGRAIVSQVG